MRVLVGVAVLMLAGCVAPKQIDEMSFSEVVALRAELVQRCAAQGAPEGSRLHQACMQQEAMREVTTRDEAKERAARGRAAAAAAMADYSRQQQAQANRRVSCTSNATGSSVYTNCY